MQYCRLSFGDKLFSRNFERQTTEAKAEAKVANNFRDMAA